MKIFKIRINYKSGIQEEVWCKNFEYSSRPNGDRKASWEFYGEKGAIALCIENVESIWQIEERDV